MEFVSSDKAYSDALSIFISGRLYLANQHTSDHHLTRSRKVKAIRSQACVAWQEAVEDKVRPAWPLAVVARPQSVRQVDVDACWPHLKACLDGLVDAGLVPDDGPEHISRVCLLAFRKVPADDVGLLVWCLPAVSDGAGAGRPEVLTP